MSQTRTKPQLNGMIISDTSIRQPVFITMMMILVIVIGLLAYRTMPVNLLPDIDVPTVAVSIPYPGANPASVAEQVAKPVEDQLQTINGLKHLTSQSNEGSTTIIAEFDSTVNVDRALQDVRDKVNATIPALPKDVNDPIYQKFDPNQQPILSIALASNGNRSPLELRQLVDDEIVPQLQRAEGVGSISVSGGQVRQINVLMDLNKLTAYRILPVQISRALQNANTDRGLGTVEINNTDVNLRAPSQLQQPSDIARVRITGTPYSVGDVATIQDGVKEVDQYARLDGKDAVSLAVRRQSGTNTIQVADAVKAQLAQIQKEYPDLNVFIPSDQSDSIRESTNSSIDELIVAAVAAMIVVFVFFRDLRNTFVTILGLPVIMIGTFAAINAFGITINLISLLALSVSVGLVIDDAIVVRENVFRQMERGVSPMIAASRGTSQVALSVLAMSLTIIAVFLPVAFTGGITGIIFKSFGITVACAMALSLVEAFTLAPMVSAYLFKQKKVARPHTQALSLAEEAIEEANEELSWSARIYEGILGWSLHHRWVVILVTVAVLALSIVSVAGVKVSFFPAQDTPQFSLGFQLPPGTPLEQTDALTRRAEDILLKEPEIEAFQSNVGGTGSANTASFSIRLHDGAQTIPFIDSLRPKLDFLPGLVIGKPTFQGSSTAVTGRDIQLSIRTNRDPNTLIPLLQTIEGKSQGIKGLTDIDTTFKPGKPEIEVIVNPSRAGDLGFTNDDIATSVRALINGDTATTFRKNGNDTDIVVRLRPEDRVGADAIRSIAVPTQNGSVPLSSIATIQVAASPTTIRRYDRENQIIIGANVVGRNVNEVQQEIAAGIKQLNLPPDVQTEFVGFAANQNEGFQTLFIAMGLSVLFVYMVLASQFGSFLQPFVIMLAMPFSFIGAFLALRITNTELSIIAMIGLIMLLGLVVKNSILMVDFTNKLRDAGLAKNDALARASAIRLRPILMTTFALIAGSLPSAIGLGEGAATRRPLAITVIGGLITSVLLTLLVIPTAYSLLDSFTTRVGRLFRRRRTEEAESQSGEAVPVHATETAHDHATDGDGHGVSGSRAADGSGAGKGPLSRPKPSHSQD